MLFPQDVVIHLLLYGDFPALHARALDSLQKNAPGIPIRVWCNMICERTALKLSKLKEDPRWLIYLTAENRPKYKVMQYLFESFKRPVGERSEARWAIWFDDDSYIDRPDWFVSMSNYLDQHPEAVYIGKDFYVHHLPGQAEFIKAAKWYKGVPWEMCPTKKAGVKSPGITFATGGYWWLRTDVLRALDWPDPRLSHNGGDTLLGEAIRQNGFPFHKHHQGVVVNAAARRGIHEAPAGCINPKERR